MAIHTKPQSTPAVRLNLGCGQVAPASWQNYDSSWHAQLSKAKWLLNAARTLHLVSDSHWPDNVTYLDLNKRWPFPSAHADAVYASHVFEHLSPASANLFLAEALRVLKPGAPIRLVVPDLLEHARAYIENSGTPAATEEFLWAINMHLPNHRNGVHALYNWVNGFPAVHKCMYDRYSLTALLEKAGFVSIHIAARGESKLISDVGVLEASGYPLSLYIEASKLG